MPRPRKSVPNYTLHKSSGQARVCWGDAEVYLGVYNSPESLEAYAKLCREVRDRAALEAVVDLRQRPAPTVDEVVVAFWAHAKAHYRRPDGTPTGELKEYRQAIRVLRPPYGASPAAEFGPLALQAVRQAMVEKGWCRTRVNKQVGRLRRIFKWAASQELVPVAVHQALATIAGLQRGRTAARETEPVGPVPDADVEKTLPALTPTLRAMVGLQRLTGLRPGEVRLLQPADVERAACVWVYRPEHHKMRHLGREKAVPLGPRARALLEPLLASLGSHEYVFNPARSREEMFAARRAGRKSKVPPSQRDRRKPAGQLKKRPGEFFTDHGYAACVRRAAKKAGVPPWHPNRIRHSFGSEVRRLYGLEAAQVLLGHAKADITQVYAERNWGLAVRVAEEMG